VASDVSARRLADLKRLLPRQVPPDVGLSVVRLDATERLPFRSCFDRVLLDAPCSGTGTLARNPEIKWRLRPEDLARLAENQARMLRHALEVLRPGGRLVYATCSLEREENEQVVERVLKETQGVRTLGRDELSREVPLVAGLIDVDGHFRTRPDLHGTDGFFAAVLGN
jgi:16S rRNA (cytosine967-C5)-methyltransferase